MKLGQAEKDMDIELEDVTLKGTLCIPNRATGLVIFSHGSGSSRFSKRNRYVASVLENYGLATLLFDLLTIEEDRIYETRFNIELLTVRLVRVITYMRRNEMTSSLRIGLFGASTGAASALRAASLVKGEVDALVSRGGRVDMAKESLGDIQAPTLFIVGGNDEVVLQLNQQAYELLRCPKKLEVIPGASHLFEEVGALEEVARLTGRWFSKHISG